MVAHPIVALLLLPLNHSLALQPLGLRLEHARQLTPRPQVNIQTQCYKIKESPHAHLTEVVILNVVLLNGPLRF